MKYYGFALKKVFLYINSDDHVYSVIGRNGNWIYSADDISEGMKIIDDIREKELKS